jgi:hypothetical protein
MAINWPNLASRRLSCAGHNWRQMRANTHPFMHLIHLRAAAHRLFLYMRALCDKRERKRSPHARLTRGNMKRIFINPFSRAARCVSIVVVSARAAKGIERECEAHVNRRRRRRVHAGAFYVCKDQLVLSL